MSIYDKNTNNNSTQSAYQLPNPLNTNKKEELDWMNIAIISQIILLSLALTTIYVLDIKIFKAKKFEKNTIVESPTETVFKKNTLIHDKGGTTKKAPVNNVLTKQETITNTDSNRIDQALQSSSEASANKQPKASKKVETINTPVNSNQLQVSNATEDIVYDLQNAWYKHDANKIQEILNKSKVEQFTELLQFTNMHLLSDDWLTIEQFCNMGVNTHKDSAKVAMECSETLINQNKLQAALNLFKARPKIQQNIEYYVRIAYLKLETGDYKGAEDMYRKLLDIDGSQSTWYLGLGYALTQLGQASEAMQAYKFSYQYADATADYISYLEDILANGSYST